jgi:hypothetical protein
MPKVPVLHRLRCRSSTPLTVRSNLPRSLPPRQGRRAVATGEATCGGDAAGRATRGNKSLLLRPGGAKQTSRHQNACSAPAGAELLREDSTGSRSIPRLHAGLSFTRGYSPSPLPGRKLRTHFYGGRDNQRDNQRGRESLMTRISRNQRFASPLIQPSPLFQQGGSCRNGISFSWSNPFFLSFASSPLRGSRT